jgi:hypothetical protein
MLLDTVALQTPMSPEKNKGRHYFDSFEKITTEYKWTTSTLRLWISGLIIKISSLVPFELQTHVIKQAS